MIIVHLVIEKRAIIIITDWSFQGMVGSVKRAQPKQKHTLYRVTVISMVSGSGQMTTPLALLSGEGCHGRNYMYRKNNKI